MGLRETDFCYIERGNNCLHNYQIFCDILCSCRESWCHFGCCLHSFRVSAWFSTFRSELSEGSQQHRRHILKSMLLPNTVCLTHKLIKLQHNWHFNPFHILTKLVYQTHTHNTPSNTPSITAPSNHISHLTIQTIYSELSMLHVHVCPFLNSRLDYKIKVKVCASVQYSLNVRLAATFNLPHSAYGGLLSNITADFECLWTPPARVLLSQYNIQLGLWMK